MKTLEEIVTPTNPEWQEMQEKFHRMETLVNLVLAAWQIGLWLANRLVESELNQRAQQAMAWGSCPKCGATFQSKGYANRQMLTLVGRVGGDGESGGVLTVVMAVRLFVAMEQKTTLRLKALL